MKTICCWLIAGLIVSASSARAQDDAGSAAPASPPPAVRPEIDESIKVLRGHIEDLLAAQAAQGRRIQELERQISNLRDSVSRSSSGYASQDDLKRLAEAIQAVDKKRAEDMTSISQKLDDLAKLVATPPPPVTRPAPSRPETVETPQPPPTPTIDQNGYNYVIKSGDSLSLIAQAYREQGIKVTTADIEKANPGVNALKLKVGQKIFIPSPTGEKQ